MAPRGFRSTRSQPAEGQASSNHKATSSPQVQQQQTSAALPHVDVVAQLSPILLGIQQALQALVQSQKAPTAVPAATVHHSPGPVREDLAQGATSNTDHFSAAQRPVSVDEDRTAFVTKAEVAALVRQEKERMSSTVACLNLRPPYPASITMKLYPVRSQLPEIRWTKREYNRAHCTVH